ncbi:competence type IV pilus major pilin ComGC [Oceanobacillus sp. FSL K6-2867]|uniref:competence type IV pilus major pilin ComGC n=1 Tax=Oceanobacillus sp. FSL K6-2867 TaxID=2954748 RepID=UPI0030DB826C
MFNNNRGFTLIEMLIVLLIISVLIILIVPNLGDRSNEVHSKGCEALVTIVQGQVDVYYMENNSYPNSLDALVSDYLTEDQLTCPNGEDLNLSADGNVSAP